MKKILFILSALLLSLNLMADRLVLIRTHSYTEIKNLSSDSRLSLNYLGNGFVIATLSGELQQDYTLLDDQGWQKSSSYFIIYANEARNAEYRQELSRQSTILYEDVEILVIRTTDSQAAFLQPPRDGSMSRLWNHSVSLPAASSSTSTGPLSPDPFIVARMAEVNTTLIQSNIQHLQDYGTRNAYSTQGVQAQNWIKSQFEGFGLSTTLFDFTMPSGPASDNVIATKTGSLYPNEYVIIGGHYDSYTGSSSAPGADDNASGTCGVMEVARIIAPYTFDRTIIFCAFSGEEYGLYGSEAYAAWCQSQGMNILGYMNMDMIGYLASGSTPHSHMIAPSSAQWLIDFYTNVAGIYLPSFPVTPGTLSGGDSDHTSFNNHGFMGIFPFEDSQNYSPYIHTTSDVMGTSVNSMEQVGLFTKAMIAATVSLANMPQPTNVTVSGTVTDFATGLPIQGATVQVVGTTVSPATTNANGQYSLSSVQTGFQKLRASKIGYATVMETVTVTTTDTLFNFQLQESPAWSFETGVFESQWTFGGNSPWTISSESPYDGLYCSKSGVIGNNQSSEMSVELYLTSAGTISFYRKVSSESGYDYLKFYIDGAQQGQWSGTLAWAEVNYPVTEGLHTFKWTYSKDGSAVAGSDCAWVDFITFPPYSPPPAPANISVSPASFSKTLGVGGTASDMLTITNSGEMDLTYTAVVEYMGPVKSLLAVYPMNANYNTGTTTTSSKTEVSLVKGYPTTQAGWMKFDVSSIPDGSVINSVEFHGYVNATYYPYWNINPVTNDPVTAAPSTLYNDIVAESASGYYLYRSEASSYGTGWKVHTLGGTVNSNLQSALTQDWFAIGIMDRDNSSSYYIGFDGWSQTNKPYLLVDYTYAPSYSWLKVNGLGSTSGTVSAGSSQQIQVTFDAGSLSVGMYLGNIRISSNDPDQAVVLVPCTFVVSSDRSLHLTVLLEGLYNGNGLMRKAQDESGDHFTGTTADQITVELHNSANYSNVVYSTSNVNLSTSGIADLMIPAVHSGSYYLTIKHRNSIETTSASPLSFSGSTISYDFSSAASQAYGSNLKAISGKYLIYGADVNQDGIVDSGDMIGVDNGSATFSAGYLLSDVNGDGLIDSGDMIIVDNNTSGFIMAITP